MREELKIKVIAKTRQSLVKKIGDGDIAYLVKTRSPREKDRANELPPTEVGGILGLTPRRVRYSSAHFVRYGLAYIPQPKAGGFTPVVIKK